MYNLDTGEKLDLDWFLNALENEEIIIGGTNPTKKEFEEIDRKIVSFKTMRQEALTTNRTALSRVDQQIQHVVGSVNATVCQ